MCKPNSMRLRAISSFFNISMNAVAQMGGVSRPYVSRVLSDADKLTGSPQFWRKVEAGLGQLIEKRRAQVFDVPGTQPEQASELMKLSSE